MVPDEETELPLDSQGQPGGPSDDEQARVDAEQRAIMADHRKMRDAEESAQRAEISRKIKQAQVAQDERRDLVETVRALEARVAALEAKK